MHKDRSCLGRDATRPKASDDRDGAAAAGSIKAKRIAVTWRTDRTVPPSMLSCRHVDCGTCDYLTCRACLFENSADGQAERDEAEEAAAAAADDP